MATPFAVPGPEYGTVGWTHDDGTIHVVLTGEIDLSCRAEIEKAGVAISDAMPRDVLVNVTDVTFFGSEGLRLLADAIQIAVMDHRRQVTLHNPDRQLMHTVELFGMRDQITVTSDT
jgi:anti-sigma B factor antagonist